MNFSGPIDFKPKLFSAISNYSLSRFKSDLIAGIVVGIVALPLAIAFGIASGVSPTVGLITAIIGGFLVSALGGCSVQIGGRSHRSFHSNSLRHHSQLRSAGACHSHHNGGAYPCFARSVPSRYRHQVHPLSYSSRIHRRYRTHHLLHSDQ